MIRALAVTLNPPATFHLPRAANRILALALLLFFVFGTTSIDKSAPAPCDPPGSACLE